MSNCKPMSLYPIICQYIKILFGTKNCHCNLIVILCLTVGPVFEFLCIYKERCTKSQSSSPTSLQFPEPGKVLVGKIDCDSQGRYAQCKQEFDLQFEWTFSIRLFEYFLWKYSRSGLVQISKSFWNKTKYFSNESDCLSCRRKEVGRTSSRPWVHNLRIQIHSLGFIFKLIIFNLFWQGTLLSLGTTWSLFISDLIFEHYSNSNSCWI